MRKINDWEYNAERGTWEVEYPDIKAFVSIWRHTDLKDSYIMPVRWEHEEQNFATYLKINLKRQKKKDLLVYAGAFLKDWLDGNGKDSGKTATKQKEHSS